MVAICAVVLFVTERLPVDLIAMLIMASLLLLGIISPEEGISGFSNKATVTVAAMFIISAGLFKTGAVGYLGKVTTLVFKKNYWLGLITVMVAVGFFPLLSTIHQSSQSLFRFFSGWRKR
jgi:di/tricarboxylate transporter